MRKEIKVLQGVIDIDTCFYKGESLEEAYEIFEEIKNDKRGWIHKKNDVLETMIVINKYDEDDELIEDAIDVIEFYSIGF